MTAFGGLLKVTPVLGLLFIVAAFASLGLPGLAHFPAEFQIFLATLDVWPMLAVIVIPAIVVTAALYLRAIQATFLGALPERWRTMPDLSPSELWSAVPLLVLTVLLGVAPRLVLDIVHQAAEVILP
jgi:NADH-quinone oxidoreductase subunit M